MPQKTLIPKVQFKFWKNSPDPQADTASHRAACAARAANPPPAGGAGVRPHLQGLSLIHI